MESTARRREANARGLAAEDAVAQHLRRLGWSVCAQRWRGEAGEIDLVVEREGCLRVVEVKLRQPEDPVGLECVDERKLTRLRGAAEELIARWERPFSEICLMVALVEPRGDSLDIHLFDDPA